MSWQCRAARPADLSAIHALLHELRAFPDAASPREVELRLWRVWQETGWSPLNQIVAPEGDGGRLLATLLFFPTGGRGAALEAPHVRKELDRAEFVRKALPHLAPRFAWVQAALEKEEPAFSAGGLPVAASLLSLDRVAGPEDERIHPEPSLGFVSGVPLEGILARTLEGSRDVPAVTAVLKPAEMLAGYRTGGSGSPERWYEVRAGGAAVGCLLLDAATGGDALTIQYLGVVPEERGRGLGRALVRQAIQESWTGGLPRMTVAVDQANAPALAVYRGHGFVQTGLRTLHFAAL